MFNLRTFIVIMDTTGTEQEESHSGMLGMQNLSILQIKCGQLRYCNDCQQVAQLEKGL